MPNIADAVAHIQAAGLPVLFVDTCILLDVIRAPLRPAQLPGCIEAARELSQLIATPRVQCILVVASFVPGEWLAHASAEADSLRAHLARLDEETSRLHGFCGLVGIIPPFPIGEYRLLSLAERLHNLSRQLLDGALGLEPDQDCIIRAHGRASSYTPPSLKGGEVKDATIIEECLEVSRRLRTAAFSPKRVFCTSNKNDYCEKGSSRLHPSLAVDFGAAGLEFAINLPRAVHEIKKPST
jgi:hypothetical protein